MKRIMLVLLSSLTLGMMFAPVVDAKPPSGDSNPSDSGNSTVDTRDIINPQPLLQ